MSIFGLGQDCNIVNKKIAKDKPNQDLIKKIIKERNRNSCNNANVKKKDFCQNTKVKNVYKGINRMNQM